MKNTITFIITFLFITNLFSQNFTRTELPTELNIPWEILYGPDDHLWVSEDSGIVSRINPVNGDKVIVYKAPDYFAGDSIEGNYLCKDPLQIGHGTLGLALDPDFMTGGSSYIYYMYSYNSGTESAPATKFKLVKLTWDLAIDSVIAAQDLVKNLPTGWDHLGGRLMAIKRKGIPYLFLTIGDHGVSETNSPECYANQADNPNNHAQDINTKNGKIHRFHLDGSVPGDNPISGNSIYTRGHRNPQGLMYNKEKDLLYDIEHGDRTDDEINILESGHNYGWKWVRGYHDGLFPGETQFVAIYAKNAAIKGDSLNPAFYSWCVETPTTDPEYLHWCTVAPSGGEYYNSTGIPEWTNSLLVTTLKNGSVTDQEVYQFKLNPDGRSLASSSVQNPNPKKFFGADQAQNGRLRDIAVSPDGKKIYLVNNFGGVPDHITVYTYSTTGTHGENMDSKFVLYPNPAGENLNIQSEVSIKNIEIQNTIGQPLISNIHDTDNIDISSLSPGMYYLKINTESDKSITKRFIKQRQ